LQSSFNRHSQLENVEILDPTTGVKIKKRVRVMKKE